MQSIMQTWTSTLGAALLCAATGSATADTLRVPDQFLDIQSAINASVYGDVIEIAAGTYEPPVTLNTLGKGITLRGAIAKNGLPATILDGGYARRILICTWYEPTTTTFENLVITRGSSINGGGVFLGSSSPTFVNCTFTGNTTTGSGGGLYCNQARPSFFDCRIMGNTAIAAGGGVYLYQSHPMFSNCTMSGNTGYFGGGAHLVTSNALVIECEFSNNLAHLNGGALVLDLSSRVIMKDSLLSGNIGELSGGGIYVDVSHITLTGCTFAENRAIDAQSRGGAITFVNGGTGQIGSTVFCANTAWLETQLAGAGWTDAGGNCFATSCEDASGDGSPDLCAHSQGDFNLDGMIDAADLALILSNWGASDQQIGDLTGDGSIGAEDLALLLNRWTSPT